MRIARELLDQLVYQWHTTLLMISSDARNCYARRRIEDEQLAAVYQRGGPFLRPYERLAAIYDDYLTGFNYGPLLKCVARLYDVPLHSVIDLGCGTGRCTAELASIASNVVGVDTSQEMLERARAGVRNNCDFVLGDFRRVELGRTFSAAISTNDALNYAEGPDDLDDTFCHVGSMLEPGGLFLFDALTEAGFRNLAGHFLHVRVGTIRIVLCFRYDPKKRMDDVWIVFPDGIERHRRIPIDPHTVRRAAVMSGFKIAKRWRFDPFLDSLRYGYVLQKQSG